MLVAAIVGTACSFARAPNVRMQATTVASEAVAGVVVPTGSVASWYDAGVRLTPGEVEVKIPAPVEGGAALLQRYLQLRCVLPAEEPLPNEVVQGLIQRAESEADESVAFDDDRIQGDWQLVYQMNAKQATRSQKALTGLPAFANFMLADDGTKIFRNLVTATKRITVIADVAYTLPTSDAPPGRLGSTIDGGVVELRIGQRFGWKPLRIPLPLKGVGWLDVTYLSDEMRITRGNRGGVFVHLRPELLTREAAESNGVA